MTESATASILGTKFLFLALALWAGPSGAQQALDLPLPQARALAQEAALSGDAMLAREIALALLEADPDDRGALVVLATSAPQLGRAQEGRQAAARAWRLSDNKAERYEAARLAAAGALAEGRPLLAELWMRLALAAAPNEAEAQRTEAQAQAARRLSPWRVSLGFGVAPSDNVNGGSESAFNVIDGLPVVPGLISVDGRALSGWITNANLSFTRTLAERERARTRLTFHSDARAVALSQEARDLIEEEGNGREISGSDFSFVGVGLRLRHDRVIDGGLASVWTVLDQDWSGGEAYQRTLGAAGNLSFSLPDQQILQISGSADQVWQLDGGADRVRLSLAALWGVPAFGSDRLTLGLSRGMTFSDNRNAASQSWGVRASYALAERIGPARVSATLGVTWSEYPDYAAVFEVPGGREDVRHTAQIEASFEDWSFAGFEPVISLDAGRTESNVSRFDTESLGLGFSFRSTF